MPKKNKWNPGRSMGKWVGRHNDGKILGIPDGAKIFAVIASGVFPPLAPFAIPLAIAGSAVDAGSQYAAKKRQEARDLESLELQRQKIQTQLDERQVEITNQANIERSNIATSEASSERQYSQYQQAFFSANNNVMLQEQLIQQIVHHCQNRELGNLSAMLRQVDDANLRNLTLNLVGMSNVEDMLIVATALENEMRQRPHHINNHEREQQNRVHI
jgi:hypothetical protein